jgi:YD repeat-containing protein
MNETFTRRQWLAAAGVSALATWAARALGFKVNRAPASRRTSVVWAVRDPASVPGRVCTMVYDVNGRLLSRTDGPGHLYYTFTYDGRTRVDDSWGLPPRKG